MGPLKALQKSPPHGKATGGSGVSVPVRTRLSGHCAARTNGSTQIIQTACIRHHADHTTNRDRAPSNVHHPTLAEHGLGARMEEFTDHSSAWGNQIDIVHGHLWHNSHKWAATQNPARHLWPVQTLRPAGQIQHRLTECGDGTATWEWDRPTPRSHRLAPSPPTQIMAPTKTSGRPVDTGRLGTVQDATVANSNTTRLPRLPTPGKVEDIPEEKRDCTGSKLPRGPLTRQDATHTHIGWRRKNWQWRGTDNDNIHTECQQCDMRTWPSREIADPNLRRWPVRVPRKRTAPAYSA
jgi:hypothetical protein